jgi:hypothetical protein
MQNTKKQPNKDSTLKAKVTFFSVDKETEYLVFLESKLFPQYYDPYRKMSKNWLHPTSEKGIIVGLIYCTGIGAKTEGKDKAKKLLNCAAEGKISVKPEKYSVKPEKYMNVVILALYRKKYELAELLINSDVTKIQPKSKEYFYSLFDEIKTSQNENKKCNLLSQIKFFINGIMKKDFFDSKNNTDIKLLDDCKKILRNQKSELKDFPAWKKLEKTLNLNGFFILDETTSTSSTSSTSTSSNLN